MKWEELSKSVQCAIIGVTAVGGLCAMAVAFDHTYARAGRVGQLEKQVYIMVESNNLTYFRERLKELRAQPRPTKKDIKEMIWLQAQIDSIETKMMSK